HILTGLEGTPDLIPELPLYVKAGDLFLKLDNPKAAVSLYERAGKLYAAQGSARSVSAICAKVLRVMPERRRVYHKLAGIMLGNGHVGPARAVIEGYVAELHLPAADRALEALGEVSDDVARPVLEMVLDLAKRHERASGLMVAVPLPAPPPEAELIEQPEPLLQPEREPESEPAPERVDLVPIGQEVVAGPPTAEPIATVPKEDELTRLPLSEPEPEPEVQPVGSDLKAEPEPHPPARVTPPGRAPFSGSLVFAPEGRRKPRRGRLWAAVAAVGVVGVGGGYALMSGGETGPVVSSIVTPTAPESLEPLPTQPETTVVMAPDTAAGPAPDTVAALPPPALVDTGIPVAVAVPDTGLLGRTIITVAELPVDRVSDLLADGRSGYEVLQTLQNGERVTVAVLPWRGADTARVGPVRTRADGASIGSVRFGRYVVDVSGRVDPGTLRDLMNRLVGRREPER
ncbi:MAG: hypothetical protein OER89_15460, partial [Gemmatimonadota bacterium]|nr:hypothetical protein [Gemmatimonadota bacterium]